MSSERGTFRRTNDSIVRRRLTGEVLSANPACSECGGVAAEVHSAVDGASCFEDLSPEQVAPICRACHNASGCTQPLDTFVHRMLGGNW